MFLVETGEAPPPTHPNYKNGREMYKLHLEGHSRKTLFSLL